MGGMFYELGKLAGPKVRKAKWAWQSLTGDEADIIQAERSAGADLAEAFRAELGLDPDQALATEVKRIGHHLAERVKDKRRTFDFAVAAHGEPNAFALPGGFIFISRSLIDLLDRRADRLAFVLGHEMGHVIKQHPMERMFSDAALSAAMRTVRLRGLAGQWVKNTGAKLMQSAYSRERELTADKLGARLAAAAGYDPRGALDMLRKLGEVSRASDGPISEYFSTHPPADVRIAELEKCLSKDGTKG